MSLTMQAAVLMKSLAGSPLHTSSGRRILQQGSRDLSDLVQSHNPIYNTGAITTQGKKSRNPQPVKHGLAPLKVDGTKH